MPTSRYGIAGATVNGVLYAMGGYTSGQQFVFFSTVEAYHR
jgi:hypothetical protein